MLVTKMLCRKNCLNISSRIYSNKKGANSNEDAPNNVIYQFLNCYTL